MTRHQISGDFTGKIGYSGCSTNAGAHYAIGTWWINVHDTTGTARFVIYVDGEPHVAYTTILTRTEDAKATFAGTVATGAGPLTVTVKGSRISSIQTPGGYSGTCP